MAEYIDTKYLFKCENGEVYSPNMSKIPTADVVEVVRCKDCKYYIDGRCYVKNLKPLFAVNVNIHNRKDNDFCSYGERKE